MIFPASTESDCLLRVPLSIAGNSPTADLFQYTLLLYLPYERLASDGSQLFPGNEGQEGHPRVPQAARSRPAASPAWGAPGCADPTAHGTGRCPPPPFGVSSPQPRCHPCPGYRLAAAPEGRKWLGRERGRSPRPGARRRRREAPREPPAAPGGMREGRREGGKERGKQERLHPPPPAPGRTRPRFLFAAERSAASKLPLRAGQEKWVFNRKGPRAWQPATAAGK